MGGIGGNLERLGRSGDNVGARLRSTFMGIAGSATQVATMFGAAFLAFVSGAGLAVRAAATLDSDIMLLHTHANMSAGAIGAMTQGLLMLAPQVGYTADALAKAMYWVESAYSGHLSVADALKIEAAAAQTAQMAHADLGETTRTLAVIMSTYGASADQAAYYSAILNAGVGTGVMTMDELNSSLRTGVLPVMEQLHVSLLDGTAAMDTFTASGWHGNMAGTALRNVLGYLVSGTSTGAKAMATLGLTHAWVAEQLQKPDGLISVLQVLGDKLNGLPEATKLQDIRAIFGGLRSTAAATELINNLMDIRTRLADINRDVKTFGSLWQSYTTTTVYQTQSVMASLNSLFLMIGESLEPAFRNVLSIIGPIIAHFAIWASANAPLIGQIATIAIVVAGLGTALFAATAIVSGFIGLALNPLSLVMVAIVGALILMVTHWGTVSSFLNANVLPAFRGLFDDLSKLLRAVGPGTVAFRNLMQAIADVVGPALRLAGAIASYILPALAGFADLIYHDVIVPLFTVAHDVLPPVLTALTWLLQKLQPIAPVIGGIAGVLATMWAIDKVAGWGSAAVSTIGTVFGKASDLKKLLANLFPNLFSGGGTGTPTPSVTPAAEFANATFAAAEVAVMNVAAMNTVPVPGGAGGPVILGPDGKPIKTGPAPEGGLTPVEEGGGFLGGLSLKGGISGVLGGLLMSFFGGQLLGSLLGGGITKVTGNASTGETIGGALGGVATGAGVGATIGSIVPGIGTLIGAIVGAIVGSIPTIVAHWDDVKNAIGNAFQFLADHVGGGIRAAWQALSDHVGGAVRTAYQTLSDHVGGFFGAIGGFFHDIAGHIAGFFGTVFGAIGGFFGAIGGFFHDLPGHIVGFFSNIFKSIGNFFGGIGNFFSHINPAQLGYAVGSAIRGFFLAVGGFFHDLPGRIADLFRNIWNGITGFLGNAAGAVGGFFHDLPGRIADLFRNIWNGITGFLGNAAGAVGGFFHDLPGRIADLFRNIWNGITGFLGSAAGAIGGFFHALPGRIADLFRNIWNGITGFFGAVGGFFHDLPGHIADLFAGIWRAVTGFFGSIISGISGFIGGVGGFIGGVWNAITGFFGHIIDGIKSIIKGIGDFFAGLWAGLTGGHKPPGGQNGAIINEPMIAFGQSGNMMTLGEGGMAEAVVPLEHNNWSRELIAGLSGAGLLANTVPMTPQSSSTDSMFMPVLMPIIASMTSPRSRTGEHDEVIAQHLGTLVRLTREQIATRSEITNSAGHEEVERRRPLVGVSSMMYNIVDGVQRERRRGIRAQYVR